MFINIPTYLLTFPNILFYSGYNYDSFMFLVCPIYCIIESM